jgi:hypothetical protein
MTPTFTPDNISCQGRLATAFKEGSGVAVEEAALPVTVWRPTDAVDNPIKRIERIRVRSHRRPASTIR